MSFALLGGVIFGALDKLAGSLGHAEGFRMIAQSFVDSVAFITNSLFH